MWFSCCLLLTACILRVHLHWRKPARIVVGTKYNFLSWKTTLTITVAVTSTEITTTEPRKSSWSGECAALFARYPMKFSSFYCFLLAPWLHAQLQPARVSLLGVPPRHCAHCPRIKAFFLHPHLPLLPTACLPSPAGGQAGHISTSQCLALLYKVFFVNQEK